MNFINQVDKYNNLKLIILNIIIIINVDKVKTMIETE